MEKKRAAGVFLIFFVFIVVIILVQISSFGSIAGFVLSDGNSQYKVFFTNAFYVFMAVLIFFFVVRFLANHHRKTNIHRMAHIDNGLIKVDLKDDF